MTGQAADIKEISDSGNLAELPFARVFARLCRQRRSGVLDIRDKPPEEGGKVVKRIIMADGARFFVQGGRRDETLGEILVAKGKLSAEQYESLKKETGGNYDKMDERIVSGAVVPPSLLPEIMSYQASVKIKSIFSAIGGFYQFKSHGNDQIMAKYILVPMSAGRVLLEGVMDHYPLPRLAKEFPDIDRKNFAQAADAGERLAELGLPPSVLRWLRCLPETFNWKTILQKPPVGIEQATVILLALYFSEIIMLPVSEDDFPVGRVYKTREEIKKEEKKKEETARKTDEKSKPAAKPAAKPEEPKLPIEEMLDRELTDEELLAEIDRLLVIANNRESTYFEILGVNEQTPAAKIKKVYFKLAKKFHPDARPDLFRGKVKDKVEDLFTKVSEAYNTLGDNEARVEYVRTLRSKISDEDMDMARRAIEAEQEFQKSEILLKRGNWTEAAQLLERAVSLQPDEPEYKLFLAWARYKIKGPVEAPAAQRIIKEILAVRPKVAEGYYYLGMIAKAEGQMDKAEENFSKASNMKPHDIDIKRELQLLQRRRVKDATSNKKGGLFGKKK